MARNHTGMSAAIRAALERRPKATFDDLALVTGFSRKQCRIECWRLANLDRIRTQKMAQARKRGRPSREEVIAAQRKQAAITAKPIIALNRKGDSYSQVGAALGITRNAVAGRLWRAKRRAEAQALA